MWHDLQILWIKWTMWDEISRMAVFFYLLQVADVVTTYIGLKWGGTEVNPIAKRLMDRIGVVPTLILGKALVIVSVYYNAYAMGINILMALVVFYIGVIVWNTKQLVEMRNDRKGLVL